MRLLEALLAAGLSRPARGYSEAVADAALAVLIGVKLFQDLFKDNAEAYAWGRQLLAGEQSLLILRARAAWAHDFSAGSSANATFQTLPGFGFTVFDAAPDRDSTLASASAEYKVANGVSFLAKFDGQFGTNTKVYAGTGAVRIAW